MDPITIQATVERFADFLLKYFVALAAVGALSMAMIELWKKLRDSRTRFHAKAVSRWFRSSQEVFSPALFGPPGFPDNEPVSPQAAYRELIHLTTGTAIETDVEASPLLLDRLDESSRAWLFKRKPEYALFALDLDRMLGHIQDAANIALGSPQHYKSLYVFMTSGADPKDVLHWYIEADMLPDQTDVANVNRVEAKRRADMYARLHQVIKCKLDAFQLYEGDRWVNWNQFSANIVGVVVLFYTLLWVQWTAPSGSQGIGLVGITIASLLGGVLAPIAKDIVVALRKVRQGG